MQRTRRNLAPRALGTVAAATASVTMLAATALATAPCDPAGVVDAVISVSPPADTAVVGVKLQLDFPAGVDLPGRADEAPVKERVRPLPGGVLYSPNVSAGSMIVALVGTAPLPTGPLLEVQFDRCKGTPAPTARDFHCGIEQGSDDRGALLTKRVDCAVTLGAQKEKGR